MFQTKVAAKIKTHILFPINFFLRKSCRLWDNVEPGWSQITIRRMRIACRIPKSTNAHSECVILTVCRCKNRCTNAPLCYVVHTLQPVLLYSIAGKCTYIVVSPLHWILTVWHTTLFPVYKTVLNYIEFLANRHGECHTSLQGGRVCISVRTVGVYFPIWVQFGTVDTQCSLHEWQRSTRIHGVTFRASKPWISDVLWTWDNHC